MTNLTQAQWHELIDNRNVTIDGRAAIISGPKDEYALIRSLDGAINCEFSWSAVANRVAKHNGQFFSGAPFTSATAAKPKASWLKEQKKQAKAERAARGENDLMALSEAILAGGAAARGASNRPTPPTLSLSSDQLDMLITAAAHEVDWYRRSTRADKAERIAGLEDAIKQFQQQLNYLNGFNSQ